MDPVLEALLSMSKTFCEKMIPICPEIPTQLLIAEESTKKINVIQDEQGNLPGHHLLNEFAPEWPLGTHAALINEAWMRQVQTIDQAEPMNPMTPEERKAKGVIEAVMIRVYVLPSTEPVGVWKATINADRSLGEWEDMSECMALNSTGPVDPREIN